MGVIRDVAAFELSLNRNASVVGNGFTTPPSFAVAFQEQFGFKKKRTLGDDKISN